MNAAGSRCQDADDLAGPAGTPSSGVAPPSGVGVEQRRRWRRRGEDNVEPDDELVRLTCRPDPRGELGRCLRVEPAVGGEEAVLAAGRLGLRPGETWLYAASCCGGSGRRHPALWKRIAALADLTGRRRRRRPSPTAQPRPPPRTNWRWRRRRRARPSASATSDRSGVCRRPDPRPAELAGGTRPRSLAGAHGHRPVRRETLLRLVASGSCAAAGLAYPNAVPGGWRRPCRRSRSSSWRC